MKNIDINNIYFLRVNLTQNVKILEYNWHKYETSMCTLDSWHLKKKVNGHVPFLVNDLNNVSLLGYKWHIMLKV